MIGPFLKLWRGGAKVVLAQRRSERASPLLSLARRIGYGVLGRVADYPVVPGATGFGLFDRAVVDTLKQWREPEPFFRGMVIESGFALAMVPFDRPPRAAGETKNGFRTLLAFALSGLSGSARSLLRLPIILSLWAFAAALMLAFAAIIGPTGRLLLLALVTAMFATLLLFLGLIGDQIRLIAERTRGVPLVIEEARLNFPDMP